MLNNEEWVCDNIDHVVEMIEHGKRHSGWRVFGITRDSDNQRG